MILILRQQLRAATLVIATAVLIVCSNIQAQESKNKVKSNHNDPPRKVAQQVDSKPDLSKEFTVLGRKAFGAIDRLDEHLLDTKDVVSHGNIMELSDEKQSWVIRSTTAEEASDGLQSIAETMTEKAIAKVVSDAVSSIEQNHKMIDVETEIAVHDWNLRVLSFELEGVSPLFLGTSGVPDATRRASDRALDATRKALSSPCYLASKEALDTGVFNSKCESSNQDSGTNKALGEPAPSIASDPQSNRNAYAKVQDSFLKKMRSDRAVRAEGKILIYVEPSAGTPDDFAAIFKKSFVDNDAVCAKLKALDFTHVRLETEGRVFAWPIK